MKTDKDSLEHLSSLMDGELNREAGMFMIRRMASDEQLSSTWARYHLVRDCLREPGGGWAEGDFRRQVLARLDSEEALPEASNGMPRWLRPVAGAAVAATVAFVAVGLVQPQAARDQVVPAEVAATAAEAPATEAFIAPAGLPLGPVTQPASYSASKSSDRVLLDAYLLRHNQVAPSAARQGFVSFLPVVTQAANAGAGDQADEATEETDDQAATEAPKVGPRQ